MDDCELPALIKSFEGVIKTTEQLNKKSTRLVMILGELFAMWCAFRIRTCFEPCSRQEIRPGTYSEIEASEPIELGTLPKLDAVHAAAEKLIAAAIAKNQADIVSGLSEMGVFALCPLPSQQFRRMESVARLVPGRVQLISAVELALFSIEIGDLEAAGTYAREARGFDPVAYELYNVSVVEGVIALNAGRYREAIQYLDESLAACQRDEYASLACGVRAPNFALIQKLLDSGERVEVLRHLLDCKKVWQSFGPQIDVWINAIESSGKFSFKESSMLRAMNEPAYRLLTQYTRARALEEESTSASSPPNIRLSSGEIMARRAKLREEYRRYKDSSIENDHPPSDT